MRYALNTMRGSIIQHPALNFDIEPLQAVPIDDETAEQLKHWRGIILFDSIKGRNKEKDYKELYGVEMPK